MTETGTGEASQNDATSLAPLRAELPKLAGGTNTAYTGINMFAVPSKYIAEQHKTGLDVPGFAFVYSVQPDFPADQEADLGRYVRRSAEKYDTFFAVYAINGQNFETQQASSICSRTCLRDRKCV